MLIKHIAQTSKKSILLFLLIIYTLLNFQCASNKPDPGNLDGKDNYKKGMKLIEKKKYLRAQEELNQAVIAGSHTEWGDTAAFYLAESYYLNKEYLLALSEYQRIIRRMPFTTFLERIRYRICECYIAESPVYFNDQVYTYKAIEEIQEFLDDFPDSEFRSDALLANHDLRDKLGRKAYETGILYIKMDEPEPAISAFLEVTSKYYDTKYFELSLLEIVHAHCLDLNIDKAQEYLETNRAQIKTESVLEQAAKYIADAKKIMEKRTK